MKGEREERVSKGTVLAVRAEVAAVMMRLMGVGQGRRCGMAARTSKLVPAKPIVRR